MLFSISCYSQVIKKDTIDRKIDLKLHKLYSKTYTQVSFGVLTTVVGYAVMMSNFDITKKTPGYITGCVITGVGVAILFTSPIRILKKND